MGECTPRYRNSEAEVAFKRAVAGFERLAPSDRELGVTLGYLRQIYSTAARLDEMVAVGRRAIEFYIATEGVNGLNPHSPDDALC